MMKRVFALILALCLCLSVSSVFAHDFTDISGHWAEEEIGKAYEAGIVKGDGNGLFRPDDTVTRAEYVKMVVATLLPLYNVTEDKLDEMYQPMGHWCVKYYNAGVDMQAFYPDVENTVETADGVVSPGMMGDETADYNIERWEMAYFTFAMAYTLGSQEISQVTTFADAEEIANLPETVAAGIAICSANGIIKGDDLGNFNPHKNGTREEATVMINRFSKLVKPFADAVQAAEKETQDRIKTYPESEIPKENVKVKFTMENGKSFTMELYPEYAPQTVANFVALVKDGFYDGLTFHRVVEGFMAQGGDPKGDGSGGAEHLLRGEFAANGFSENTLKHTRGVVSMARTNHPDGASCQFFICYDDAAHLDGQYAAFGKVIEGMEVV
ncbi:MAG: peptidylprolyl isomerase, partial [Clostridia bacterium]|nr:peptidylprolyl isomerase [Clostridia bacterium]